MKDINVLSFSGGRTSAYMLAKYKDEIDYVIFCNTGKEAEGTLDFVRKCGEYFDKEIIWLEYNCESPNKFDIVNFNTASRNGEPFEKLIKKNNYLPSQTGRKCTTELKVLTVKRYLKSLNIDLEYINMYLGIRKDEPRRYYKIKGNNKDKWENKMPLFKDNTTLNDVLKYWSEQPFDLDIHSHLGNCDLCFNKRISKKQLILKENPEVAKWWIEMEDYTGKKFNITYSIKDILNLSISQLNVFDNGIECFCNID
jgi:3'-phosphoadenosine 5'-phosphosulfate sulfotransferase (PAPS reductase)/FAD synthetase